MFLTRPRPSHAQEKPPAAARGRRKQQPGTARHAAYGRAAAAKPTPGRAVPREKLKVGSFESDFESAAPEFMSAIED